MLALVLGSGLGLTRRVLAPVRQLTQTAREINFRRRVPLPAQARPARSDCRTRSHLQ
jgi:hypothetical protein